MNRDKNKSMCSLHFSSTIFIGLPFKLLKKEKIKLFKFFFENLTSYFFIYKNNNRYTYQSRLHSII